MSFTLASIHRRRRGRQLAAVNDISQTVAHKRGRGIDRSGMADVFYSRQQSPPFCCSRRWQKVANVNDIRQTAADGSSSSAAAQGGCCKKHSPNIYRRNAFAPAMLLLVNNQNTTNVLCISFCIKLSINYINLGKNLCCTSSCSSQRGQT